MCVALVLASPLFLPNEMVTLWFRTPCPYDGDEIDLLEAEAAAVADAVFGPIILRAGYAEELAFVDNNCSLAWVTRGAAGPGRNDVNGILEGLWLQMALRKAFKRWERVSSTSNVANLPSRGKSPEVPCTWDLREIEQVGRWDTARDGLTPGRTPPH